MRIASGTMAVALAATLALAGCGGSQQQTKSQPAAETTTTEQATDAAATTTETATDAAATTEAAPAPATEAAPAAQDPAAYVGDEAAKAAALAHAGLAQADVTELSCELDLDDAVAHYDVDFKSGGMEYEYDIDAATGAVISFSSEVDD